LDFQFLLTEFGLAKEFLKTKVGKAFFLVSLPSCAEISFWGPKKTDSHLICTASVSIWVSKARIHSQFESLGFVGTTNLVNL
jgi:hypothetical protein